MRFWKLLTLTVAFGIVEDLIAVWVVTQTFIIDGRTLGVVLIIATLFALLMEWLHRVGGLK
jgi:hypothetical protein